MIELGYRYYKLYKTHVYSVVASEETKEETNYWNHWNQWLWYWLKFKHAKNVRLMPYHSKAKILAKYKRGNAKTVANLISKKIEKHRKRLMKGR